VARNSKRISRKNGTTKISTIIRNTRILTKAKALRREIFTMTTLKFVKGVVVATTSLRSATLARIWLNSIRNLLANKFKGTSMTHTSLLNLLTPVVSRILLWKIMMRRSLRGWTTYSALMICSWNSNPTTYLETPTSLYHPKT
jgi:transposase